MAVVAELPLESVRCDGRRNLLSSLLLLGAVVLVLDWTGFQVGREGTAENMNSDMKGDSIQPVPWWEPGTTRPLTGWSGLACWVWYVRTHLRW